MNKSGIPDQLKWKATFSPLEKTGFNLFFYPVFLPSLKYEIGTTSKRISENFFYHSRLFAVAKGDCLWRKGRDEPIFPFAFGEREEISSSLTRFSVKPKEGKL